MQTAETIKEAARRLDAALEKADVDTVLSLFAKDCELELLGVKLEGRDGVRRWLAWLFAHVRELKFEPRVITVEGDVFIEEFVVVATLHNGTRVRSHQAEVLAYCGGQVASLRLYFDPLDFARAAGVTGRLIGPLLAHAARRGLQPFAELDS